MRFCGILLALALLTALPEMSPAVSIQDGLGRTVAVPDEVDHIICSGPGCLRLAVYLGLEDRVVAVDSAEEPDGDDALDARPYALAKPEIQNHPIFGQSKGRDNPELILALDPGPQVIFKALCTVEEADKLQAKTGIPVVAFDFGDLGKNREKLYGSLNLMAKVTGTSKRAKEIEDFFEGLIQDLARRTEKTPGISSYVGGIAFRGPHGLLSTEPSYPPFMFLGVKNAASGKYPKANHAVISKEALLEMDPDTLFIDMSTINFPGGGALKEIKEDPIWKDLKALKTRKVYGVLPYNWYSQNFGSILADGYFIGSVLFPENFKDLDPREKADDIYEFLVGKRVFKELDENFSSMIFREIDPKRPFESGR